MCWGSSGSLTGSHVAVSCKDKRRKAQISAWLHSDIIEKYICCSFFRIFSFKSKPHAVAESFSSFSLVSCSKFFCDFEIYWWFTTFELKAFRAPWAWPMCAPFTQHRAKNTLNVFIHASLTSLIKVITVMHATLCPPHHPMPPFRSTGVHTWDNRLCWLVSFALM